MTQFPSYEFRKKKKSRDVQGVRGKWKRKEAANPVLCD